MKLKKNGRGAHVPSAPFDPPIASNETGTNSTH